MKEALDGKKRHSDTFILLLCEFEFKYEFYPYIFLSANTAAACHDGCERISIKYWCPPYPHQATIVCYISVCFTECTYFYSCRQNFQNTVMEFPTGPQIDVMLLQKVLVQHYLSLQTF